MEREFYSIKDKSHRVFVKENGIYRECLLECEEYIYSEKIVNKLSLTIIEDKLVPITLESAEKILKDKKLNTIKERILDKKQEILELEKKQYLFENWHLLL